MALLNQIKKWMTQPAKNHQEEVDVLRKIVSKVEELPPDRGKYIACFSYLLGRVAHCDFNTSKEELEKMEKLVQERFKIEEAQAVLICEMAKSQNEMFGSTENFIVAREFREVTSEAEREDIVDFLFQIAAADDSISSAEETEISQMASELGVHRDRVVEIRQKYRDKREVFRS